MNNKEIFDIVKKMRDVFESESLDFEDIERKNAFISEINNYFNVLYGSFKSTPDDEKKDEIIEYIREMQDNINGCFGELDYASFNRAKDFVDRLNDYLTKTLGMARDDVDAKSYQEKLDNYKSALKRHRELEKNYKSGNVKYASYIGSYNVLVSLYNSLINDYKKLGDSSLEKPQELKMIPKSVDDLLLKDMQQEQQYYEKLFDFYEGETYPDYEEASRRYDAGEIEKTDYEIEASTCLNQNVILNREYDRLQAQFGEYEKMFNIEVGEYKTATEEELNIFYVDLAEYNELIEEYRKQLRVFEEIKQKFESGSLSEEEYQKQLEIISKLEQQLTERQKSLQTRKRGIYNNSALNILKKRRDIILSHLKNAYLSEDDRKKLSASLEQIQKLINEINQFRATIVIKSFKKSEKRVRPGAGSTKSKTDYLNIDKPTEPVFFGDDGRKPGPGGDDVDYAKMPEEYKKLLEAYNEQLYAFYEKEKKFVNGEIPYEGEYEKSAVYITELYNKIQTEYGKIYGYYEKEKEKIMQDKELSEEEKTKKGMELEAPEKPQQPYISMEKEEELVEVKKVTVWQWIKDHKKQILIALGLTALAVSIIVLVTQLLPAIMAAMKASQAAGLFSQMVSNATAWHTAIASEKIALHGANTALASQITALTGMPSIFNTATGIWTIGGNTLANAAAQSAVVAGKAASLVGALQGVTLSTGLGGLGLLGTGLLLKEKSVEFKVISYEIRALKNVGYENLDKEIAKIQEKIKNANISEEEKKVLNKKLKFRLNSLQRKLKRIKGNIPEEDVPEEDQNLVGPSR